MRHIVIRMLGGLIAVAPAVTWAAKAPISQEELEKQATHIVAGDVVEVTSTTQKSTVETALGIHRDRVFRIHLLVREVLKGADLQNAEQIEIVAWQPSSRIPPLTGLQGHESIPGKGDTVTVYLKGKEGIAFKPLLPNGITIKGFPDIEERVAPP